MASFLLKGCFSPTTLMGLCSVRSGIYGGSLLGPTIFRSCATLFRQDYQWSSDATQWFIRRTNTVRGTYRPDCWQDTGGPVPMEGTGPGFEFQSGHHCGGSVLGSGDDSASFCNTVYYGATGPATRGIGLAPYSPSRLSESDIAGSGHHPTTSARGCSTPVHRFVSCSGVNSHRTHRSVEHEIDTSNSAPIHCAPRRMSPQKLEKEEECVTDMLTCGQIEPSDSPWSSPVVLVMKNTGVPGSVLTTATLMTSLWRTWPFTKNRWHFGYPGQ